MWARQTENMQSCSFYVCLCLRLSVSREAVFFSSMRDTWRDSEKEQNKISEKNMMTEKTKFYFLLYINPRMLVWGYFCFHCADEYKIGHQDWAVVSTTNRLYIWHCHEMWNQQKSQSCLGLLCPIKQLWFAKKFADEEHLKDTGMVSL